MNCQEFRTHLPPYVDGELGVDQTLAATLHAAECPRCDSLAERERRFRKLLRRQPRESAPPELRARILARCRREAQRGRIRRWLAATPGVAAATAAAALVLTVLQPGVVRPALVGELVGQHMAFAQVERPAEFASGDRAELENWLRQRAGFRATVPDYSPAGIRLVGARIVGVHERKAAYVLYEKGHTLLSVFMMPTTGHDPVTGARVSYRGQEYVTQDQTGYRTVAWWDGQAVYALVSTFDYQALLECADSLREERKTQNRL